MFRGYVHSFAVFFICLEIIVMGFKIYAVTDNIISPIPAAS